MSPTEMIGMNWIEDLNDLTLDELRDLPADVQMGLDLSIFD